MSGSVVEAETVVVDIGEWVEKSHSDPVAYIERQATEVFLAALGMTDLFGPSVFLKGGILMGVVYQSARQTADIDFTTTLEPDPTMAEQLKEALDSALPRAAAELGYPDLMCRIQSVRHRPRPESFASADGPALEIKVGYARRGSRQEKLFLKHKSPTVLYADISFREPVGAIQVVRFAGGGTIRAYSLSDLMAEKMRALLQQEVRNRYRRQDIYDLRLLITMFPFDDEEKSSFRALLIEKCKARNIAPDRTSLSDPAIVGRARKEWDTLQLEIGEVPDFDECFAIVDDFYQSLPWE